MKKFTKMAWGLTMILVLLYTLSWKITATAAEEQESVIQANTLQKIQTTTQVYESADDNATVTGSLEAGTPVIVLEEPQGDWCKVQYQETEGYVPMTAIAGYGDETTIQKEMSQEQDNTRRALDELELEKQQKKQTIIWGCIIGVLVIAVFATGIVSAIRKNKKEKTQRPIYKG